MIEPLLSDDALLTNILTAPDDGVNFHLWWLGQSGFLLKWQGRTVLFDPYLSDSLTKKYAGTDKKHIRMTRRCIAPQRLGFVDIVTSSHAHTDHFDAETLIPLASDRHAPLPLVLPAANLTLARQRLPAAAFTFHGLDAGQRLEQHGFEFTGIPAAHDEVEYDHEGHCRYLGFIVRFGRWTLYHSGDTRLHDELPGLLRLHHPDVMLLPINGHDPARRVAGNMNGTEAAHLAREAGAAMVIPHHYDLFAFNTASPDEFMMACARLQQPFLILHGGEKFTSDGTIIHSTRLRRQQNIT